LTIICSLAQCRNLHIDKQENAAETVCFS
jgi:hypothetical protein